MWVPGTQMHFVTFGFICIELVILFYLIVHRLARPDDKTTFLNIILIALLITYNVTGGLLPDPNLPGSYFVQMIIAYATGFITPCYFPYYVFKAFGLEKMRFHAYRGVYLCLIFPYLIFVLVFAISGDLETAKNLLVLPVLYALWVIYSLIKAIRYKYSNNFSSKESKEEVAVLFLSITPWVGLPVIDFFNLGQAVEACTTNIGFLLLFALHLKRNIRQIKTEHQRLVDSESRLLNWSKKLQEEVDKRTKELQKLNEQKTHTLVNLAHETKTPLTLVRNYLEEYMSTKENPGHLAVVKRSVDKLTTDINNLFDLERFNKGFAVYNHDLISNFSEIVNDNLLLFQQYSNKREIEINTEIEEDIFIKADPAAIHRIVNNLVENAIKFSDNGASIDVSLKANGTKVYFSVKDYGIGIPSSMQKKIFEPYYQIANRKTSVQGMGLGLPIVKKVIEDIHGEIQVESNPGKTKGTKMLVVLNKHQLETNEVISTNTYNQSMIPDAEDFTIVDPVYCGDKQTILIVEDNIAMMSYLVFKLGKCFNVYAALNGNEALQKLKTIKVLPDLIISDVMMDKVDGYTFAKIISKDATLNHIPFIFLTAKCSGNDRLEGLKLGAIDFILKPFSINELVQKIESILLNASKQRKAVFTAALNSLEKSANPNHLNGSDKFDENCSIYNLTCREHEIARLICKGLTQKAIGEKLFIAEKTVAKHVQNIFEKADVSNKMELSQKLGIMRA